MMDTPQTQICLTGVNKSYAASGTGRKVLDNVQLEIAAGEFVVVMGRSGSGKSTLLNLMAGLDEPTSGRIRIGDRLITDLTETERALYRRRHLGFVFQFFNLLPTLTAAENTRLPLALTGCDSAEADERCAQALDEVGLGSLGTRFPDELSGGEQQRIAIARALIHRPEIVFADEPTGNLDLDTAREVLRVLDEVCRKRGATLVMATHSAEVVGIADRVLTIRDAQIFEADT